MAKNPKLSMFVVRDKGIAGAVRRWHARKAVVRMILTAEDPYHACDVAETVLKSAGYACDSKDIALQCGFVKIAPRHPSGLFAGTLRHCGKRKVLRWYKKPWLGLR